MKRTQLNFDEQTYLQVVDYARKQRISLSSAVRTLLAKQLKKEVSHENPLLGLAELGKKLKVRGGPPDLSINHDYYLYGEGSPEFGNDILPALRYRSRRGILSGSPKEDVFSASIPISSGSIHPRLNRGILEASNKKKRR